MANEAIQHARTASVDLAAEDTMNVRWSDRVLIVLGVFWAITVATGFLLLWRYQMTAGAPGNPTTRWPASNPLLPPQGRTQLILAAHPPCACTRASIESLARIMARARGGAVATVPFLKPWGMPDGWEHADVGRSATANPGVRAVGDEDGGESSRFGLETSGHTLSFDREGRLSFSGGITDGRGHHGDNAGMDNWIALITGARADSRNATVFGCPLHAQSTFRVAEDKMCRTTR